MSDASAQVRAVLAGMGAPESLADPLVAALGPDAADELAGDPWRLLALPAVTPDQADYCARRALGDAASPDDLRRGRALVARLLAGAVREGSTAVDETALAGSLRSMRVADPAPAVEAALDEGAVMAFEVSGAEPEDDYDGGDPPEVPEPDRYYAPARVGLAEQDLGEGIARLIGTSEPVMDPATAEEAVAAASARLGEPVPAETAAAAITAVMRGVTVLRHGAESGTALRQAVACLAETAADSGVGLAVATTTAQSATHFTALLGGALDAVAPGEGGPSGAAHTSGDEPEEAKSEPGAAPIADARVTDTAATDTAATEAGAEADRTPEPAPRPRRSPAGAPGSDHTAKAAAALHALTGITVAASPEGFTAAGFASTADAATAATATAGPSARPKPATSRAAAGRPDTPAAEAPPVEFRPDRVLPLGRLLEAGTPVPAGIMVVADAMALDVERAAALVEACEDGTHLVLLADPAEAPSARPGQVVRDLAESRLVALAELPADPRPGPLGVLAQALAGGELALVDAPEREVVLVEAASGAEAAHRAVQLLTDSIPRAIGVPVEQVQIIAATRGGDAGADALNRACKERLNPGPGALNGLDAGDRVLCGADGPGYSAGDVGYLRPAPDGSDAPHVLLSGGSAVPVDPAHLRPGWAVTVAAAHGGHWPAVVAVFGPETRGSRPQAYTALTRASRHLSVVHGAGPELARAIAERTALPRTTRLTDVIRDS